MPYSVQVESPYDEDPASKTSSAVEPDADNNLSRTKEHVKVAPLSLHKIEASAQLAGDAADSISSQPVGGAVEDSLPEHPVPVSTSSSVHHPHYMTQSTLVAPVQQSPTVSSPKPEGGTVTTQQYERLLRQLEDSQREQRLTRDQCYHLQTKVEQLTTLVSETTTSR